MVAEAGQEGSPLPGGRSTVGDLASRVLNNIFQRTENVNSSTEISSTTSRGNKMKAGDGEGVEAEGEYISYSIMHQQKNIKDEDATRRTRTLSLFLDQKLFLMSSSSFLIFSPIDPRASRLETRNKK